MIPIGDKLKALRNKKGLSLRAVGKEIGISFNTLSAYERNIVQPTLENCYKMAEFFEVPIEYFIFGEKSNSEFRDASLLKLFHEVDELEKTDRTVIKNYIKKYIKTKKALSELIAESEDNPDNMEEKVFKKKGKKNNK